MYHALEDEDHPAGAKDAGEQLYVLHVRKFREQMESLHREGYSAYFLDELDGMDAWPEKGIVITFDDGHKSNYTLALPILQKFGFKAQFFVTTDWIGAENFMTADQIRKLHAAGMRIGSHGVTHSFISDLDRKGIDYELAKSKLALERIIEKQVTDFSAPGGRCDTIVVAAARLLGYSRVITSVVGLMSRNVLETAVIPRCIIRTSITVAEFAAIAAGDGVMVGSMARKARVLGMAKKVLGNRLYEKVRATLVNRL